MSNILIRGAGLAAGSLIQYMLHQAAAHQWNVTVADADFHTAEEKMNAHPKGRAVALNVLNADERKALISNADIVISLLPPHLHIEAARDCATLGKHLITASYVSKEIQQLDEAVRAKGLLFMGEMGLDPGIDHMSAMQSIHQIQSGGGVVTAFRSYTGGLVAPESDTNPWHYKISWNPRNVVLAGQGTAQYMENGQLKFIPYNRLFKDHHLVYIPGMGPYEAYANRDSLSYRSLYEMPDIPSILRGTLRHVGFCEAWNALVQIGLTDASFNIADSAHLSYHQLLEGFMDKHHPGKNLKERVAHFLGLEPGHPVMEKLDWLGLFSNKKIGIPNAGPAVILENLLLEKWPLLENDKDMVIMQHEFEYNLAGKKHLKTATLVMKGENRQDTAMAKTVGLPMGILAKLVLLGKIPLTGVHIPVMKEVYEPVLEELTNYGVVFEEHERLLD